MASLLFMEIESNLVFNVLVCFQETKEELESHIREALIEHAACIVTKLAKLESMVYRPMVTNDDEKLDSGLYSGDLEKQFRKMAL